MPALSRADSSSPTQAFITGARSRKWDIEVDDVRQQLNNAPLQGGSTAGPEAFEDDGWFGPLLVRHFFVQVVRFVFHFLHIKAGILFVFFHTRNPYSG